MTDYRTASEMECRDFVAKCQGWQCATSGWYKNKGHGGYEYEIDARADDWVWHRNGLEATRRHPLACPDTADIPLPPVCSCLFIAGPTPHWVCTLGFGEQAKRQWENATAPTERLARWRCAALAWERYVSEKKEPARE